MTGLAKFSSLALLAFAATACSDEVTPFAPDASQELVGASDRAVSSQTAEPSILDLVLTAAGGDPAEFTILKAAVEAASPAIGQTLDGKGRFTVFAPTDVAFLDLLDELDLTAEELLADTETLDAVLLYHVSRGAQDASEVLSKTQIRMLSGEFARVDGAMARINDAMIIDTDIEARNGFVHVIDKVLLPPSTPQQGNKAESSILDLVLAAAGADEAEFTILKAAVESASPEIAQTLEGNGQFTVFAPTDAAFLALLEELGLSAEQLLADTETLNAVLLYHVTRGRLLAAEVTSKSRIRMLDGNFVRVSGATLNDDTDIIEVDLEARNGVVHVIDEVLLPPN
jgi:uncharacterized surface protein with fasciclin (FAS1) repeats